MGVSIAAGYGKSAASSVNARATAEHIFTDEERTALHPGDNARRDAMKAYFSGGTWGQPSLAPNAWYCGEVRASQLAPLFEEIVRAGGGAHG